jgi:flagellar hook protein FlgE
MPFRIALSGLNAAAADLRVIGSNVANSSTVGFKKSRTEFSDIYAASSLGAAANTAGSGVKVSGIKQEFAQGNIDFTNNNLDMAISGEGFFRLSEGGTTKYSRAGSFSVDREGYVVNNESQRLTGFQADTNGNITGAIGDIQLSTQDLAPNATTSVSLTANLDSSETALGVNFDKNDATTYNHSTSLTTYDSRGNSLLQTLYFQKTGASSWNMYTYLTDPSGADTELVPAGGTAGQVPPDPMALTFTADGAISTVSPGTGATANYDPATIASLGSSPIDIDIDLNTVTQFGTEFGVNELLQDGYTTGRLSGVDVGETGVITARYTNGQSLTLAQVAMANFSNLNGLLQLGDTSWAESFESGAALVGTAGTGTMGLIQSGALEGSNVDLTEQLVNMITAQRNFQSNAQVIQTADTVTQTIINIR